MSLQKAWTPERALQFMIIPPALLLVPTFVLPLAVVLSRSVSGSSFDFSQFHEILGNTVYLKVLYITFKTALISTIVALLIGFPIAQVIATAPPVVANLLFACVMVPLWTSVVTRTYAWLAILGRGGVLNSALQNIGLIDQPLTLIHNQISVQIGMVQVMMPMMILPLVSTMRQIDRTKLMAAEILGANPIRAFVHIYVPMCLPGIVSGSVLVFITALGFYVTPALLGGDQNTMIAVLIEQQVTKTLNWPLASALATVLLLVVITTLWAISLIAKWRGIKIGVS
ncbi:ABC transporter permease [Mesorhizobium sp. M4B.F.Ca.ET.017.02.2.1]|uniref:ABC transporter permease n=1 Tax=Mesorhizobium sp. M4B.F.Ca.ET.017.02.2.1 TaxID=2496649 RepID=UPI000FCA134C|nr:ABC transporter permease [Mesorhizobium sp. M4B.F.Ca.ET.017.02.2.1]RVD31787.1 ABC transporter permease [Mesorhizobium sp. M4B.F.Ca.ET.017.02.2.1]